ncbi:MAG: hypothetical protein ACHQ6T_05235 [Myxococcota bacterium]
MSWLAREATVRRIVDGARRGRAPVILGGPGMGRTSVASAAAARLRAEGIAVEVRELGDDDAELGASPTGVCLRTGGLALHRALARDRALQRVPLVPLLRRDLRAWAAGAGFALGEEDLERAFRASGGHPAVFAAWLDAKRASRSEAALEQRVLASTAALFARVDRALAHPELAKLWDWIASARSARVAEIQRATGATKAALDRLAIAGPVARTLGAAAEISVACELYARHRVLSRAR